MTATTAAPVPVTVTVPHRVEGRKSWAKAIRSVDTAARDGHGLDGPWLDRGARYVLPAGTVLVTVDRERLRPKGEDRDRVRLVIWKASPGADDGLELVSEHARWDHIGRQMLKKVASAVDAAVRVPSQVDHLRTAEAPPRPNRRAEQCRHCRVTVEAGRGVIVKVDQVWRVQHPGKCPPRTNYRSGRCGLCAQWVDAYAGLYNPHLRRVEHRGECPPPAYDGMRPNGEAGPCAVCWQKVLPMQGILVGNPQDRQPMHDPACPPNPYNPAAAETWQVREADPRPQEGYDYPVGTIARIASRHPLATGPGERPLLGGGVSLIGVVVASVPHHTTTDAYGRQRTERVSMWRAATEEEAAPVLRAELQRLVETGLVAQARDALALLPGQTPADAAVPPTEDLLDAPLWTLPRVWVPTGAGRPETTLLLDAESDRVWTLVHNSARDDDWSLNNFGGYIAVSHPLTPARAELVDDLQQHQNTLGPPLLHQR